MCGTERQTRKQICLRHTSHKPGSHYCLLMSCGTAGLHCPLTLLAERSAGQQEDSYNTVCLVMYIWTLLDAVCALYDAAREYIGGVAAENHSHAHLV